MVAGRAQVATLLALGLCTICAGVDAAGPADPYRRVTELLATVKNAPDLDDTVHADPRVLKAIGWFLEAIDPEKLPTEQMCERFVRLVPFPPWEWAPIIDVGRIRSRLYLVSLGSAVATQPSSLYLFDRGRYVRIDSGTFGTVRIEDVDVDGDRIHVAYFPTPSGGAPRLTSALVEKSGSTWRVKYNTPYRKVTALLARVDHAEIQDPGVHRHPLVLEAFGVFLQHAGRLNREDLHRHMFALFADNWYRAWPTFDIRPVRPRLYLVTIDSDIPNGRSGSLYLFDGASYVTLTSDDMRSHVIEGVETHDHEIEVTYTRRDFFSARLEFITAVAKKQGGGWRVTTREACPSANAVPCR